MKLIYSILLLIVFSSTAFAAEILVFAGDRLACGSEGTQAARPADARIKVLSLRLDAYSEAIVNYQPKPIKALAVEISQPGSFWGPELEVVRTLAAAKSSEQFLIVKVCAVDASLQKNWLYKQGYLYRQLLPAIDQAVTYYAAQGISATVSGFFWNQGEADISDALARNYYGGSFQKMLMALRSRYNSKMVGLIVQSKGYQGTAATDPQLATIRSTQSALASCDDLLRLVPVNNQVTFRAREEWSPSSNILVGSDLVKAYLATLDKVSNQNREFTVCQTNYEKEWDTNLAAWRTTGNTQPRATLLETCNRKLNFLQWYVPTLRSLHCDNLL